MNKKAVIDLPVRLMVVFLILALSIPVLTGIMENNREYTASTALNNEFEKFFDTVSKVHYSGSGSIKTVVIDVPDNCVVEIGGTSGSAYSIRGYYNGSLVSTRYMEQPAIILISDLVLNAGKHTLIVTSVVTDGKAAAEVGKI